MEKYSAAAQSDGSGCLPSAFPAVFHMLQPKFINRMVRASLHARITGWLVFPAAMLLSGGVSAQQVPGYTILDTLTTPFSNSVWYVSNSDTMAKATYVAVEISSVTRNRAKKKKYDKFQEKVVKVYPYARAAGDIMKLYDGMCMAEPDPVKRRKLLDRAEQELKLQFEKDLRKMTVSEGVILIRLIDRETGSTGYSLVQQLKGGLSAFMWQSVARIFGHNLKDEYESTGEDLWIENIVLRIEDGSIPVQKREVDPFGMRSVAVK